MALMVLNLNPQYLQVYWGFSVPSYTLWKPLFGPSGWRGHLAAVSALTLAKFIPQYSQEKVATEVSFAYDDKERTKNKMSKDMIDALFIYPPYIYKL